MYGGRFSFLRGGKLRNKEEEVCFSYVRYFRYIVIFELIVFFFVWFKFLIIF